METEIQNLITQELIAAGWHKTTRGAVFGTSNLEYSNGLINLEVDYYASKKALYLTITENSGKELNIVIYFQGGLMQLLHILISFQDLNTSEDCKRLVSEIIKVCPLSYMELGDQMVKLVDDENFGSQRRKDD